MADRPTPSYSSDWYSAALLDNLADYLSKVAGDPVRLAIWLDLHDLAPTAGPGLILAAIAQDFAAASSRERRR